METAAPYLRPLGIGEVLDVAMKIAWRNAATLFKIVFFVVFPVQVLTTIVQLSAFPDRDEFETDFETGTTTFDGSDFAAAIGAVAVAGILGWLASTLASGACFRAIASAYLGERTEWKPSLAFAARRLHSILWVTFLGALAAGLGFLLCVIPGVYLWTGFAVAVPALLTEDQRGSKALGRSRRLVRGFWWRTFAIVLLGYILSGIISAVLGGVVGGVTFANPGDLTAGVLAIVSGTISAVITTPFVAAFTTVLYFDLRVRKEAFDLKLLAERIGVEPPARWVAPPEDRPGTGGDQPPFWPPPPGWKPGGGGSEPAGGGRLPFQSAPGWKPPDSGD
jgi:hypothetical protein